VCLLCSTVESKLHDTGISPFKFSQEAKGYAGIQNWKKRANDATHLSRSFPVIFQEEFINYQVLTHVLQSA